MVKEERPWWAPIREALVKKAAQIITEANLEEWVASGKVIDVRAEDVVVEAITKQRGPYKRRKALPAHPDDEKVEGPGDLKTGP